MLKRGEQEENCRISTCSSSLVSSSSSESMWWYRSERADRQTEPSVSRLRHTSVCVKRKRTVEVTGVVLRLQLRDELGFLPQKTVPVQICEERVLLHLQGASCRGDGKSSDPTEPTSRTTLKISCVIVMFLFLFLTIRGAQMMKKPSDEEFLLCPNTTYKLAYPTIT